MEQNSLNNCLNSSSLSTAKSRLSVTGRREPLMVCARGSRSASSSLLCPDGRRFSPGRDEWTLTINPLFFALPFFSQLFYSFFKTLVGKEVVVELKNGMHA